MINFIKSFFKQGDNIRFSEKILNECRQYLPDKFISQTTPATYEQFTEFLEVHEFELAMSQLESIADDLEDSGKSSVPQEFWVKMYSLASKMELEIAEYYKSKIIT